MSFPTLITILELPCGEFEGLLAEFVLGVPEPSFTHEEPSLSGPGIKLVLFLKLVLFFGKFAFLRGGFCGYAMEPDQGGALFNGAVHVASAFRCGLWESREDERQRAGVVEFDFCGSRFHTCIVRLLGVEIKVETSSGAMVGPRDGRVSLRAARSDCSNDEEC